MKKWESPKLIALVRARPEESILGSCKTYSGPTAGPNDDDDWCWNDICQSCTTEAAS